MSTKQPTFDLPIFEEFLTKIDNLEFKSSSDDKIDMYLKALDYINNNSIDFNFSIKSFLGKSPTLLNSSKATRLRYNIVDLSTEDFTTLNNISSHKKRFSHLKKLCNEDKCNICFESVVDESFCKNLQCIDKNLISVLSYMLFDYYSFHGKSDIKFFTERIIQFNPLKIDDKLKKDFYKNIINKLIEASALYMQPKKFFDKQFDNNVNGFIFINQRGDVLFKDYLEGKDEVQDYFYNSLKFDMPSTSKKGKKDMRNGDLFIHKYENETFYFDLNLQIRFK